MQIWIKVVVVITVIETLDEKLKLLCKGLESINYSEVFKCISSNSTRKIKNCFSLRNILCIIKYCKMTMIQKTVACLANACTIYLSRATQMSLFFEHDFKLKTFKCFHLRSVNRVFKCKDFLSTSLVFQSSQKFNLTAFENWKLCITVAILKINHINQWLHLSTSENCKHTIYRHYKQM